MATTIIEDNFSLNDNDNEEDNQEPGVQARRSRIVQDAALPGVLWDKLACHRQALVASR
jgi:hypothetical protein